MHKTALYYLLALFAISCQETDLKEVESLSNEEELPLVVMENAEIEFTDSAHRQAVIASGLVENYTYYNEDNEITNQKLVMNKGVNAQFYSKSGEVTSTMTSYSATRYENERKTEIEGNVVVVNQQGDSLSTEFLLWDEGSETISSDRKVRVKKADEIIFAEGFTSDVDFTEYTFKKVTGTISLN